MKTAERGYGRGCSRTMTDAAAAAGRGVACACGGSGGGAGRCSRPCLVRPAQPAGTIPQRIANSGNQTLLSASRSPDKSLFHRSSRSVAARPQHLLPPPPSIS